MDKTVMEVFVVGGVAIVALAMGFAWLRKPKLAFMAWPAFGVAGAVAGILLQRPEVTQRSLWLAALAMTVQMLFDGWKRSQATSNKRH
jgi:hypothetical protein